MLPLNDILGLRLPLVLASQSPRRQALLSHVGFRFTTVVPNVDESVVPVTLAPDEYVRQLSVLKAEAGARIAGSDAIVIGSDTTVVLDGAILNKPVDADDAVRMLRSLSGRTHTVYTGIALCVRHGERHDTFVQASATHVTFRPLLDAEIDAYVASGSPMDKAGAYGIQDDYGAVFVRRVEGCYYTIVGLPMEMLFTMLQRITV